MRSISWIWKSLDEREWLFGLSRVSCYMLGDFVIRHLEWARAESFASDCSCLSKTFLLKASDFLQMVGFCFTSDIRAVSLYRFSFSRFTSFLLAAEYSRLDTASAFSFECLMGASCEQTLDSLVCLDVLKS